MINFCDPPPVPAGGPFKEVAGRVDTPSETAPRSGGIVGAILLMAVLFVLVLGVYGAVSIDTFGPARMQHTTAPAPSTATTPSVATEPPSLPPTVAIPDQVNPTAGRTFEAAKPAYWVEYGAYRGSFYAQKLVERLGTVGIKAEIKQVRGAGGELYYSVRSAAAGDRAAPQTPPPSWRRSLASCRCFTAAVTPRRGAAGCRQDRADGIGSALLGAIRGLQHATLCHRVA